MIAIAACVIAVVTACVIAIAAACMIAIAVCVIAIAVACVIAIAACVIGCYLYNYYVSGYECMTEPSDILSCPTYVNPKVV